MSGDAIHKEERKKVLIVDDSTDLTASLSKYLEILGHTVRTARNGTEALLVARDFLPDVALIDIGLPGLDGWQVARELRKSSPNKPLLIAVTGRSEPSDRVQSKEAGFDHHFTKPLDLDALQLLLAS